MFLLQIYTETPSVPYFSFAVAIIVVFLIIAALFNRVYNK